MILKRLIVTVVCVIASKMASAQVRLPSDTITMYTKDLILSSFSMARDTLVGYNESGRFEEHALILKNKKNKEVCILSMCRNLTTSNPVKLIRIGNNLFKVGNRYIVKIDDKTLKAFAKSFEYPRHCDHYSHRSHRSHYSHYSGY